MSLRILRKLPQKGNNNYKVLKSDFFWQNANTDSSAKSEEKLMEIAQLLSGSKITDAAFSGKGINEDKIIDDVIKVFNFLRLF